MMNSCGTPYRGITIARLHELLIYDHLTGLFKWKNPSVRQAKEWFAGNKSVRNYRRLYIDGQHYMAHFVGWSMYNNRWPDHEIDHDNRVQDDNKISNLFDRTHLQNTQNRSLAKNNKTGINGVTAFGNKFRATIRVKNVLICLGLHATAELAGKARERAEVYYCGK